MKAREYYIPKLLGSKNSRTRGPHMSQDEKYTAVIIVIASDAAKAISVWEAFRELFLDYAEEVIEALTPVAEAMSIPFLFGVDEPYLSTEKLEDLFKQVEESCIMLTGTSPKSTECPSRNILAKRPCTTIIFPEHPGTCLIKGGCTERRWSMLDSLIWCNNQSIDTEGKVICLAHLAEGRIFTCPYTDNADRLRAEYPCSDYQPDSKKELGYT